MSLMTREINLKIVYQVVDGVLQDVVAGHEVVAVGGLGLDK